MTAAHASGSRAAVRTASVAALAVIVVVVGVVVGLALAGGRARPYEGSALLQATAQDTRPNGTGRGPSADPTASAGLAVATAAAVDRSDVLDAAERIAPGQAQVRADADPGTATVEVTARADDARTAAVQARTRALALRQIRVTTDRALFRRAANQLRTTADRLPRNQVPATLSAEIVRLDTSARTAIPLAIVRSGEVRRVQMAPAAWVFGLVGGILGFVIVVSAGVARRAWRRRGRRITSVPELRRSVVPVLGVVARPVAYVRGHDGPFGLTEDERELLRITLRGLEDLDVDEAQVVLVTSAQAAAGKSTVAAGLASVAANGGRRVLLVECDLRLPSQADRLGLRAAPGLAEYLAGTAEPRQTLQEARCADLTYQQARPAPFWTVTAGDPGPSASLDSALLNPMFDHLRGGYDLIVLDAPPLIGAADSGLLLARADVVVVCARLGEITWDALNSAVGVATRSVGERRVGIIATDVRRGHDPAGESRVYGSRSGD